MAKIDVTAGPGLVTAAWHTRLPPEVARISISRGPPRGQRGYRRLTELAPGPWFATADEQEYIARYSAQLAALDPVAVYQLLIELACGAPTAALLCFERPATSDGWCHRSLAAGWLARALEIAVPEFGYAHLTQEQHPMLPPSLNVKFSS